MHELMISLQLLYKKHLQRFVSYEIDELIINIFLNLAMYNITKEDMPFAVNHTRFIFQDYLFCFETMAISVALAVLELTM